MIIMQDFCSDYYVRISKNIKKLRLKEKLSQEKFSEKIGCSREYISRLENYHEHAGLDFILKLAYIYHLEVEYFFASEL